MRCFYLIAIVESYSKDGSDKETQDAFAIELSRRGFVVLAIDLIGHGSSTGLFWRESPDNTWGGNAG